MDVLEASEPKKLRHGGGEDGEDSRALRDMTLHGATCEREREVCANIFEIDNQTSLCNFYVFSHTV